MWYSASYDFAEISLVTRERGNPKTRWLIQLVSFRVGLCRDKSYRCHDLLYMYLRVIFILLSAIIASDTALSVVSLRGDNRDEFFCVRHRIAKRTYVQALRVTCNPSN